MKMDSVIVGVAQEFGRHITRIPYLFERVVWSKYVELRMISRTVFFFNPIGSG